MIIDELYTDHSAELQRYALRLARDPTWAADLVQDTFIRAMGHHLLLNQLERQQQRAWLYRTLKNRFFDEQLRRQRHDKLLEQIGRENLRQQRPMEDLSGPNPFELVPPQYREIVEKHYRWGQTSEEIAADLGIPAATVRSRLHLAMKKLRLQQIKLK
jgi:RNA polymerase sigma-70 factor (ECF subfamily)